MKICPKCGVQHPDDVEKCPICNTEMKKRSVNKLAIIIPGIAIYLVAMVIAILMLTHVICINHDWEKASCTQPEVCRHCGKVKDSASGHLWKEATCDAPKTCKTCGETEGAALGHTPGDWEIKKPSTLTANGTEAICCRKCNDVIESRLLEKKIPKIDGSSFNFTESELVAWLQEIGEVEIGEDEAIEGASNATYEVSNKNGDSGIIMVRHVEGNKDGNIGGILVYFNNSSAAVSLVSRIGAAIDPKFSREAASLKLSSGDKYFKASMAAFMYDIDGLNTAVLVPAEYYNTKWEK